MATKVKTGVLGTLTELNFADNGKAQFGAGNDLQIYHDASNSYIDDAGTGGLSIRSNLLQIGKYTGELSAQFVADGESNLYYDNSKKIATTTSGVQIGINNDSTTRLQLYGANSADHEIFFGNDGTNGHKDGAIRYYGETNGVTANRRAMTFSTANSERMRITSAGDVGIGMTPSATRLDVTTTLANNFAARFVNSNSTDSYGISISAGTDANDYTANFANRVGTSLMRIRGDGNVGIGTASPQETLHLFNSNPSWNQYSNIRMSSESDSYAAEIGFHRGSSDDSDRGLFLSGDGTNKHVRVLHGGNVGIGTVSPTHKLHVAGTVKVTGTQTFDVDSGGGSYIAINHSGNESWTWGAQSGSGSDDYLDVGISGGTRAMSWHEDGKVGIGTTTNHAGSALGYMLSIDSATGSGSILEAHRTGNSRLEIYQNSTGGNYIDSLGTTAFTVFATGGTERMRIDTSDTMFGKASNDINTQGFHIISAGTYTGTCYSGITGATTSSTYHVRDTTNNTWKFYVTNAGVINATTTSITSLSDERLKENIKDLETGLTEIMSLKPRKFDWKEGEGNRQKNVTGFIAQEIETVFPDLIDNFMHDDLEDAKSVRTGDLIPTLVKAIQELKAEIEELKENK